MADKVQSQNLSLKFLKTDKALIKDLKAKEIKKKQRYG